MVTTALDGVCSRAGVHIVYCWNNNTEPETVFRKFSFLNVILGPRAADLNQNNLLGKQMDTIFHISQNLCAESLL